eukprot:COSAG01_NODE_2453_length_7674_cov_13.713003_7_plen_96_part_00
MTEITLPLHPLGWRPLPTCSLRINAPETAPPVHGCSDPKAFAGTATPAPRCEGHTVVASPPCLLLVPCLNNAGRRYRFGSSAVTSSSCGKDRKRG